MPKVARIGDEGSHGGVIVTGASRTLSEGSPIARQGDTYACIIHGPNPIVGHSAKFMVEGKFVARVGDVTACGAVITTGAARHFDE